MALTFNQSRGSAIKSEINSYAYVEGPNKLRIVGDILARYVYWMKGENNKNIPMEALCFDRNKEAFVNEEKDWIKVYHPDMKCNWNYVTQIVVSDGDGGYTLKVLNLKKKYWEQVVAAAKKLGDPTDPKKGWDLVVIMKKTGALAYNVEYQLDALACENRPLNAGELKAIKDIKSMDEVMARPTPDAQKELLDRIAGRSKENEDSEMLEDQFKVA